VPQSGLAVGRHLESRQRDRLVRRREALPHARRGRGARAAGGPGRGRERPGTGRSSSRTAGTTCTCPSPAARTSRGSTSGPSIRTSASVSSPRIQRRLLPFRPPAVREGRSAHGQRFDARSFQALGRAASRSSRSWPSSRAPSLPRTRSIPFPRTESSPGARVPHCSRHSSRGSTGPARSSGRSARAALYFAPILSPDERSVAVCRRGPGGQHEQPARPLDLRRGAGHEPEVHLRSRRRMQPSLVARREPESPSSRTGGVCARSTRSPVNGSGEDELVLRLHRPRPINVESWSPDGPVPSSTTLRRAPRVEKRSLPAAHAFHRRAHADPLPRKSCPRAHGRDRSQRPVDRLPVRAAGPRRSLRERTSSPQGARARGKWQDLDGATAGSPDGEEDGKELFYTTASTLMTVAGQTRRQPPYEATTPRPLFDVPSPPRIHWTASSSLEDGQRFLVNLAAHTGSRSRFVFS
jgi:hypothetical protein